MQHFLDLLTIKKSFIKWYTSLSLERHFHIRPQVHTFIRIWVRRQYLLKCTIIAIYGSARWQISSESPHGTATTLTCPPFQGFGQMCLRAGCLDSSLDLCQKSQSSLFKQTDVYARVLSAKACSMACHSSCDSKIKCSASRIQRYGNLCED